MSSLDEAFDAERFRETAHQLVDLLADHLSAVRTGRDPEVVPWEDPEEAAGRWSLADRSRADGDELEFFREVLAVTFRSHHPRNMGHQVGTSAPLAAAAEFAGALLDTGTGVYEVGNPATPIERALILDLTRRFGLGDKADGFLTSGGTLGNLTALLAARQASAGYDVSQEGIRDDRPLAILASEEAHYCVARAARVMGLGEAGMITVPVDARFRMRAAAIEEAVDRASGAGIRIIAVVASAATTATGVFDPLDEIGEVCRRRALWFHVDAAHGGAVVFSERHRHRIAGIEWADSIVLDFHKLLLTPSVVTAVLFRSAEASYGAFAENAEYLWQSGRRPEWFNMAKRTMECTKPMMSLRPYLLLRRFGPGLFGEAVDRVFETAGEFARLLREAPDFELLAAPESNILCYRFIPEGVRSGKERDALNTRIRTALVRTGRCYLVETRMRGRTWLRSAIMNPATGREHLQALLGEIRAAADRPVH